MQSGARSHFVRRGAGGHAITQRFMHCGGAVVRAYSGKSAAHAGSAQRKQQQGRVSFGRRRQATLRGCDGTRHYPLPGPFCMAHAVGEAVRLVPLSATRLSIQPLCAWRQTP